MMRTCDFYIVLDTMHHGSLYLYDGYIAQEVLNKNIHSPVLQLFVAVLFTVKHSKSGEQLLYSTPSDVNGNEHSTVNMFTKNSRNERRRLQNAEHCLLYGMEHIQPFMRRINEYDP